MKKFGGLYSVLSRLLEVPFVYSTFSKNLTAQKISSMAQMLPATEGLAVLDVGCGPGVNTHLFLSSTYMGVDINPEYIKAAQKQYPDCKFMAQDANNLDFPEGSFDLVIANSFFHHLSDEESQGVFRKLSRVLKQGGSLILSEPLIPKKSNILQNILMRLDRGDYFRTHDQYSKTFQEYFDIDQSTQYPLKMFGSITGWIMLVFKLKKRGSPGAL